MKKTFSIGNIDAGIFLGGTQIYTTGGEIVSVDFTCKYASSVIASSQAYGVSAPSAITGSVTVADGEFTDVLSIKYYTTNQYDFERTVPTNIGSTVYPMVSWEVTTTAIGFFIQSCDVIDASNSATKVKIIDGSCYAGVVSAAIYPDRSDIFNHQFAKFFYTSFSFNTDAADRQKISCAIQFCTIQADGTTPACGGVKPETDVNNCPKTTAYSYNR